MYGRKISSDQHRRVYTQMIALGEQQAIDLVTLTEELHRRGSWKPRAALRIYRR